MLKRIKWHLNHTYQVLVVVEFVRFAAVYKIPLNEDGSMRIEGLEAYNSYLIEPQSPSGSIFYRKTQIIELALFPSSFFPGVNFGYANFSIITLRKKTGYKCLQG